MPPSAQQEILAGPRTIPEEFLRHPGQLVGHAVSSLAQKAEQLLLIEEDLVARRRADIEQLPVGTQHIAAGWPGCEAVAEAIVHAIHQDLNTAGRPTEVIITLACASDTGLQCPRLRPLHSPLHGPLVRCMRLKSIHKGEPKAESGAFTSYEVQQPGGCPA